VRGAPSELQPFLVSINGLLAETKSCWNNSVALLLTLELRIPFTALSLQADNFETFEMPAGARERHKA
jgi:two-component system OmpR family sensor kinase